MSHEIRFVESAKRQLRAFNGRERTLIVASVEDELSYDPLVETRNRKELRPNLIAPWELRIGNLRVFYEVAEPEVVTILAIGEKRGSTLYIGGEEIQL